MLNLPQFDLTTRMSGNGKGEVFDPIRKKYVALTPEENVRQLFLMMLTKNKSYPASLIAVEKSLVVNNMQKRFDAVAFNSQGKPLILMEFKSPKVKLSQAVFEQISVYNIKLKVNYLIISNGINHYCYKVDFEKGEAKFLQDIPCFDEINH
jgi:hypothetical protein